jgi:tetratricopeptide (TPR) repeat protein
LQRPGALAKKAIKIEPNEAHFFGLLGDIASINDRLAAAQKNYRQAIRLNDRFFYSHLQSGLVSQELGELDAAKASLKRSIELLPTASAYNALGEIAESEGNIAQAKKYFAAASKDNGKTGQAALTSLIRLNAAANPGAYITTTLELAGSREWIITLHNTAPRDFTGLKLVLAYADQNGRMRRQRLSLSGHISAQNRRRINSGLSVAASLYPPQVTVSEIQLLAN